MEHSVSLSERVKRGDVRAFAAVFEEYQHRICRYLCTLVHDAELAEDLAQETFLKAYKALSNNTSPQNFNAWLYSIATNTAFSALRRRRLISWLPFGSKPGADEPATAEDHATSAGERELVRQCLTGLQREDAACLLLRFQEGLAYDELAQVLGTSIPAAKMRVCRARAAFRETYLDLSREGDQ